MYVWWGDRCRESLGGGASGGESVFQALELPGKPSAETNPAPKQTHSTSQPSAETNPAPTPVRVSANKASRQRKQSQHLPPHILSAPPTTTHHLTNSTFSTCALVKQVNREPRNSRQVRLNRDTPRLTPSAPAVNISTFLLVKYY